MSSGKLGQVGHKLCYFLRFLVIYFIKIGWFLKEPFVCNLTQTKGLLRLDLFGNGWFSSSSFLYCAILGVLKIYASPPSQVCLVGGKTESPAAHEKDHSDKYPRVCSTSEKEKLVIAFVNLVAPKGAVVKLIFDNRFDTCR